MAYIPLETHNCEVKESFAIFPPSYLTEEKRSIAEKKAPCVSAAIEYTNQKVSPAEEATILAPSYTVVEKKKNGRKGAKKSRTGCFTCKKRKLKCVY